LLIQESYDVKRVEHTGEFGHPNVIDHWRRSLESPLCAPVCKTKTFS
jgi:hypothetical protein